MKIIVSTLVHAPINTVWNKYTTPSDIVNWNTASDDWHTVSATVNLTEGGVFSSRMEAKDGSMGFDFAGIYTQIKPYQLLQYTFGDRNAEVIFEQQNNGVKVTVRFDAETTHPIEQQKIGWQAILNNFAQYVENSPSATQ